MSAGFPATPPSRELCINRIPLTSSPEAFEMDSQIKYLLSLRAVRERSKIVGDVAKAGNLSHFDVRDDKLDDVVDFVASVIKVGAPRFHGIFL